MRPVPAYTRRGVRVDLHSQRVTIAIGSDHAGFELKQHVIEILDGAGSRGRSISAPTAPTASTTRRSARRSAGRVRDGDAEVGIVLGGSGQGEQLAANKVRGVRAALCNDLYTARMARAHNDANVLVDRRSRRRRRAGRGDPRHVPGHRVRRRPPRAPRRRDHGDRGRGVALTMPFPSDTTPDTELFDLIDREVAAPDHRPAADRQRELHLAGGDARRRQRR